MFFLVSVLGFVMNLFKPIEGYNFFKFWGGMSATFIAIPFAFGAVGVLIALILGNAEILAAIIVGMIAIGMYLVALAFIVLKMLDNLEAKKSIVPSLIVLVIISAIILYVAGAWIVALT